MQLPWLNRMHQGGTIRTGAYRSDRRYHLARWTKLSKRFLSMHPLCEECRKAGIVRAAEVCDHIKPAPLCSDEEFFNEGNLQALCSKCNIAKGNRDKKLIQKNKKL